MRNYGISKMYFSIGTFILLFWVNISLSQNPNNFPCYISNGNSLFEFNPTNQLWTNIGAISFQGSTSSPHRMEAMAINSMDNLLYVVDQNVFGIIDINTLVFTPLNYTLGEVAALGENGIQFFDKISAMTYDHYTKSIWAINRNEGIVQGGEDFLIKINPDTGDFISKAFENEYDYVIIPSVYDGTLGRHVYDVEAIALNPYTNTLYAIQSQQGPGLISIVNTLDGGIESVIYDFDNYNVKGLSITSNGMLLGVSSSPSLIGFDISNGLDFEFGQLNLPNSTGNFESIVCNMGVFDLALKIKLTSSPIFSIDDEMTFEIEVINQGNMEVDYFTISVYHPSSSKFFIKDNNWSKVDNQKIETIVSHTIYPGESYQKSLTLKLTQATQPEFVLAAEITEFENSKIAQNTMQNRSLPDIDSTPDAINNETNIMDDATSAGGPKVNEDEDDHDIVKLNLNLACENRWHLTNNLICGAYFAHQSIFSTSQVLPSNNVQFISGGTIILESGFSIDANTSFEAEISDCPQ